MGSRSNKIARLSLGVALTLAWLTPAAAQPTSWAVTDMESTATGAVTLHALGMSEPYQGGRELWALGTLDGEVFTPVALDWPSLLGSFWHDHSGGVGFGLATTPAPAQEVSVTFGDGASVTTVLPDTSGLRWGAVFWVDVATGDSYWVDEDHDGNAVDDLLYDGSYEGVADHLAGSPGDDAEPVVVAPPDDGREEAELVQVAPGAFELDPPGAFGDADGEILSHEALLNGQQRLFEILAAGSPTHWPDHGGRTGRDGMLALRPVDLSAADWTDHPCDPGTVCVAPDLGRVLFSSGNELVELEPLGGMVTHWGDPTSGCLDGNGLGAITQRESDASVILVDVSDPDELTEVAAEPAGWAYDCAFVGDRLYVTGKSGVTVFDVSDPTAPVGGPALQPSGGSAVTVVPLAESVLIGQEGRIDQVDGADPQDPLVMQTWVAPAEWEDYWFIPLDEGSAYVSDGAELMVYELGAEVTELACVDLGLRVSGSGVQDAVRVGDFLYASVASDGLLVIDLTTATVVQQLADVDPGAVDPDTYDHLYDVSLGADGRIWTAGDDGKMDTDDPRRHFTQRYRAYDIGPCGALIEASRFEAIGPYASPWQILTADADGMTVIDGEYGFRGLRWAGAAWEDRSGIPSAGLTNDVAFDANGRAYTAEYLGGGLHMVELDPTDGPRQVDYLHRGTSAWGIGNDRAGRVFVGGRVHGAEWDGSTFNSWSGQVGIDVYQDGAYLTNIGGKGMYDVVDLGDFLATLIFLWDLRAEDMPLVAARVFGASRALTLVDGRYLVAGPSGSGTFPSLWADEGGHHAVMVLDLAIPVAPAMVYLEAVEADDCQYGAVEVAGDQVLFTRRDRLEVWDFSDPRSPTLAVTLTEDDLGQPAETVEVRGDHLHVHTWGGVEGVFDIGGGLESPVLLDTEETPTFGYRSRLHGEHLVQTSYWGLEWYRVPRSSEVPEQVSVRYFPAEQEPETDDDDTTDDDDSTGDDDSATGPPGPEDDCRCQATGTIWPAPWSLWFLTLWLLVRRRDEGRESRLG